MGAELLFLSPHLPHRGIAHAGGQFSWAWLSALSACNRVHLVTPASAREHLGAEGPASGGGGHHGTGRSPTAPVGRSFPRRPDRWYYAGDCLPRLPSGLPLRSRTQWHPRTWWRSTGNTFFRWPTTSVT